MIKVDIISGFLGSGKTTLIKKLLHSFNNEKVVIIENEFGKIGIDGEIIKKDGFEVIELQNGCICCSIKLNFKDTILEIIKELNPDRIIIEPTGIGLLSEIIAMLNDCKIKESCVINSLITVVDGINYFDYIDSFGDFFEDQILNASMLIISKSQFIDDNILNDILNSLKNINKRAYIVSENWEDLSSKDIINLLNGNVLSDLNYLHKKEINETMKGITSISIEPSDTYNIDELESIFENLKSERFGKVIRGKGFLDSNNKLLEFNYINGHYTINESKIKTNPKICIIGKNLKKDNIINIFR
ncbi:GTP-binding protein [Romboutsia sp.]|uniref:GTP-binding protein n=1 Tax=Romboutsia sp. TaxID=1965302 RepID=UPI002B5E5072|nr:GTP-binding protein [Romboutsia sp.]HSQ89307.1 GTP-binding protein [Romboutsia sp.]